MAVKNQSPAEVPDGTMQPEETKVPELLEITELRAKHKISRAIFDGVCADKKWKPGKIISEAEFAAAVAEFTGAPMDGSTPSTPKTNKESEES